MKGFSSANPISGKIQIHKLQAKILSINQIARFLDSVSLKESSDILDF